MSTNISKHRARTQRQGLPETLSELQDRLRILSEDLEKERQQRIRLERLAAIGAMTMELAHEIRNPLASIEVYASTLGGEFAEQIIHSVRLLNHSMTNVLQFGQPIVPSPKRMSASGLLERTRAVLQPLAAQKRVRLDMECGPECNVVADYELMQRMLLNLVLNALRETPAGGRIRLAAEARQDAVFFLVENSGAQMSQDELVEMFNPVLSTNQDGRRLGLSIAKKIVDSHDGQIYAEPVNNGKRIVITLPLPKKALSRTASKGI